MCGRFTLTVDPADLQDAFPQFTFPEKYAPRYNISPTQPILAIPNDGKNSADFFIWGLIPSWAKDPSIGSQDDQRARGDPRRKTILSGGIQVPPLPDPGRRILRVEAAAGDEGQGSAFHPTQERKAVCLRRVMGHLAKSLMGGTVKSATIITTAPNSLMAPIHNRMPVILPQ